MNEALSDQIRLLKNKLNRQQQEYEDKLAEIHDIKDMSSHRNQSNKQLDTSIEGISKKLINDGSDVQLPNQAVLESDEKDTNGRKLSEIEVS